MAYVKNINTGEEKQVPELNQNLADQGYVPITPESLAKASPLKIAAVEQPSVYDISKLDVTIPKLEMTAPEQEASGLTSRIAELNKSLIGEEAYRTDQESAYDIAGKTQTYNDLASQIKTLQNEDADLQNQYNYTVPNKMQNWAEGKGVTAGGLAPLSASELRKVQIKRGDIASRALTTSSLLEAAKGNLATAQTLVDRAVAAKYSPVKAEIDALTKNLQLIINSPEYSLADKNRAQVQLEAQASRKSALEAQESAESEIKGYAIEAAKNGADALTLQKIQNAQTPEEALQLAGKYLATEVNLKQKELEQKIQQQAFENNVALENLELDKAKFASDQEYQDAQLELAYMKLQEGDSLSISDKIALKKNGYSLGENGELIKTDMTEAELKQQQSKEMAKTEAQNKLTILKELLSDTKGVDAAVGPNAIARSKTLNPISSFITSKTQNFVSKTQQLISQETLNTLLNLKKGGGTLGALSDQERLMLQNAASAIGGWAIYKDGKVVGYDVSEKLFKDELTKMQALAEKALNEASSYNSLDSFLDDASDEQLNALDTLKQNYPDITDNELLELINEQSFSMVGGDTNKAVSVSNGVKEGQCGRFVNKYTGLGLGDSYQSKIAKMDKTITKPEPGMVFVMPYKNTGHTGFIQSVNNDGTVTVKDSNWGLDEKVQTHKIPISKITGLRRINTNKNIA